MFLPLSMKRVRLLMTRDDAPTAALQLAKMGLFEPDCEKLHDDVLPELPAEEYQQRVKDASAYLDKVLHFLRQPLPPVQGERTTPPTLDEVAETATYLQELWARYSHIEERQRSLQEEDKRILQLENSLQSFSNLDIDLGLLHGEHTFLDIRVGTVPLENVERLREALSLADYRLENFFSEEEVAHVLIAGPIENYEHIDRALDSAAWHSQTVPEEFEGYPEQVKRDLESEREPLRVELEQLEQERAEGWQSVRQRLLEAADTLLAAAPYADLGGELKGRGALTMLSGWVPVREMATLTATLQQHFGSRYILSSRDPAPAERNQVPTALRHRRWLAPFAALVENYGMPRYGELDPTVLFALSFVAMFGMMFGDVGHGLLIAASGLAFRRKLGKAVSFIVLCGASSALFGLLYGSIFGYEELFHPLWISPLSDPVLMLSVALVAGIFLITMATLLTIRNRIADGEIASALMDGKGGAGLLLYGGLCYIGYRTFAGEPIGSVATLLVLGSLLLVAIHIWMENSDSGVAERLLIVVVEGFETVMNYVSGTLSFLRISAFSLNHVALAIAVFTIANSLDTVGYWITVVLGNLIIVVLEGAIVMIQALRLEYYEGFSRFLSGSGHGFKPLRLHQPTNRMI